VLSAFYEPGEGGWALKVKRLKVQILFAIEHFLGSFLERDVDE
jgi:hypothetical protein